jgi:holin-like protein
MLIRSLIVVFGCLAAGEAVIHFTHLPLPSSIFGLIFLFALLQMGWVKIETMQALTTFLMENMSLFLVPPCVAVITHLDLIKADFWPIFVASILSTFLVLIVTGKVHYYMRKRS